MLKMEQLSENAIKVMSENSETTNPVLVQIQSIETTPLKSYSDLFIAHVSDGFTFRKVILVNPNPNIVQSKAHPIIRVKDWYSKGTLILVKECEIVHLDFKDQIGNPMPYDEYEKNNYQNPSESNQIMHNQNLIEKQKKKKVALKQIYKKWQYTDQQQSNFEPQQQLQPSQLKNQNESQERQQVEQQQFQLQRSQKQQQPSEQKIQNGAEERIKSELQKLLLQIQQESEQHSLRQQSIWNIAKDRIQLELQQLIQQSICHEAQERQQVEQQQFQLQRQQLQQQPSQLLNQNEASERHQEEQQQLPLERQQQQPSQQNQRNQSQLFSIKDFYPGNQAFKIKAKIVAKSNITNIFFYGSGYSRSFTIELIDVGSTHAQGIFYNESCDEFYSILKVGSVYTLEGQVHLYEDSSNFWHLKQPKSYYITFNENSHIQEQDEMLFIPQQIKSTDQFQQNDRIDVLVVVDDYGRLFSEKVKWNDENVFRRTYQVYDKTGMINVTFWEQHGELQRFYPKQIIAISQLKVESYLGKVELSGTRATKVETKVEELQKIQGYDQLYHMVGNI